MARMTASGHRTSLRARTGVDGPTPSATTPREIFPVKPAAETGLVREHELSLSATWLSPALRHLVDRHMLLGEFAQRWLTRRDLKPRTPERARRALDRPATRDQV